MKNLLLALTGLILLNACEKNDGKQRHVENRKPDTLALPNQDKNPISVSENQEFCYLSVLSKDSAKLSYTVSNNKVSGRLIYNNFEKDSQQGAISGTISGDTLKLKYKFASEGVNSERENILFA